jgi:hypothetical protein
MHPIRTYKPAVQIKPPVPLVPGKIHYIAQRSRSRWLPASSVFPTYDEAVDFIASMCDLRTNRRAKLYFNHQIKVNRHRDGCDFAQILECDCDNPLRHNGREMCISREQRDAEEKE